MKNNLLVLLVSSFLVHGCSNEEDDGGVGLDANDWNIQIENVTATYMTYSVDFNTVVMGEDVKFGYRKKGDSNFTIFDIFSKEITSLEPFTEYELRKFRPSNNDFSSKSVSFTTLPFDINKTGYDAYTSGNYVSSFEGFQHVIKVLNLSPEINSITARLVPENTQFSDVIIENVEVKNDSLYFSIPKEIIPDAPYELYRTYHVEYMVDKNISDTGARYKGSEIIVVYNKIPYINDFSYSYYTHGGVCGGNTVINMFFKGAFISDNEYLKYFDYIPDESVNAIITRLEDNTMTIIQPYNESNGSEECGWFMRVYHHEFLDFGYLPSYHHDRGMNLRRLKGEFPNGDYKIRFTFDKGEEFYETNEYFFTIEE